MACKSPTHRIAEAINTLTNAIDDDGRVPCPGTGEEERNIQCPWCDHWIDGSREGDDGYYVIASHRATLTDLLTDVLP